MTLRGFLDSYACTAIVTLTLLGSQSISIYVLLQHLLHYNNHRLQSYVVRILVFMPIYGAITYVLHLLPGLGDILEMLRNIWEGLLIHSFLCLMMEYCGGESNCGQVISRDPAVIKHPWPICSINSCSLNEDIPLNVGFVKRCRMGTMQYAFVRPLLAILSVVFRLCGIEKWLLVSIFKSLVINISVYVALYALGLFYLATKNHPGLKKANCLTKCLSLKVSVVFTFYQHCIIFWFTTLDHHYAERLSTFLVLIELPFFAMLQKKAYGVDEFFDHKGGSAYGDKIPGDMENPSAVQTVSIFDDHVLNIFAKVGLSAEDIRMSGSIEGVEKICNNASMALNMTDLFNDIYYNCSDRYRKHSLLTQDNADAPRKDLPLREPKTDPIKKTSEDFAEFDKVQSQQRLEEQATTLAKLQFI
ncbi:hypothetical protein X943_002440 [Babesia divergens]|uniref:Uncharacterized protein n=1 Tax=Babesia divergens TaxID=32595 RepID=A0AAD9GJP7_BABDI|nr:hypothetical protein X943_002440 [Babesia divergens]